MRYLSAILAIGLLVAVHELGHLWAARLFRIRVLRYSIGFGPPIFSLRRGETEYVLAALPFGGYCQIDPESFQPKAPWKRILVLAAGSLVNDLLAVVLLTGLFLSGTQVPVPLTVGEVQAGSEAARALIRPGDRITAVDGRPLQEWLELVERVNDGAGKRLVLSVVREGQALDLAVTPVPDEAGAGHIGVSQQGVFRRFGLGGAIAQAAGQVVDLTAGGFTLLARVLRGRHGPQLTTPIGIVKDAAEAAKSGWDLFLRLLAGVSVALAVFNLMPFPALDGGRIALTLVEAVRRRPLSPRFEGLFHTAGFVVLIALFVWLGSRDLRRLFSPSALAVPAVQADAGR